MKDKMKSNYDMLHAIMFIIIIISITGMVVMAIENNKINEENTQLKEQLNGTYEFENTLCPNEINYICIDLSSFNGKVIKKERTVKIDSCIEYNLTIKEIKSYQNCEVLK